MPRVKRRKGGFVLGDRCRDTGRSKGKSPLIGFAKKKEKREYMI